MLWNPIRLVVAVALCVVTLVGPPAHAAELDCTVDTGKPPVTRIDHPGTADSDNEISCGAYRCDVPEPAAPFLRLEDPSCDPLHSTCDVELVVPFEFPGNSENSDQFSHPVIYWFEGAQPPACDPTMGPTCGDIAVCGGLEGQLLAEKIDTVMEIGASCDSLGSAEQREYSIRAYSCTFSPGCRGEKDVPGLDLTPQHLSQFLGCPGDPPPQVCPQDAICESCVGGGLGIGGSGVGAGGDGGAGGPATGNGAYLYYAAGGVGHPGFPGTADWTPTLGRYWSHSYAARIVEDPDASHVWLLTEHGTFREFGNPDGAGVFETLAPSDEYRTLTTTGTGWELRALDGMVTAFDGTGRWLSNTDRNGNPLAAASYDAVTSRLDEVTFHDGRLEHFTYYPSGDSDEGKLETITEVGVDGTTRVWTYRWTGDDLMRIERPDGTAVVYTYGDGRYPGYLTLIELEGTDGVSRRVERGYGYDDFGNAVKSWRGATAFDDPLAVDRWELLFDDPADPTETRVRDPLYPLSDEAVYTLERDPASRKPRVVSISGDCPTCTTGPNATMDYDPAHPLLPSRITDGNGNVTTFTYTDYGQVKTRTEADGVDELKRTTTWTYEEPAFPALVTTIERPSVDGTMNGRKTTIDRDTDGNETLRTITGVEGGTWLLPDGPVDGASAFTVVSQTSPNSAGQPLWIDPDTASYGTADRTVLTYDSARGDLIPLTRTDPLVGTTVFVHDGFNRRTHVTDPNGVTTVTEYDPLDRVTTVTVEGDDPGSTADDLITVYEFDVYRDLKRVVLPRGNLIEYDYEDHTGRLIEVARWDAGKTEGERVLYVPDPAGNRIQETHQRWDPATGDWRQPADATTDYHYDTRCRLDRIVYPDGAVTEYAYDCNGNLKKVWDAEHDSLNQTNPPTATYGYDALDRLTAVTRPWDGGGGGESVTTYGYDSQDHLVTVKDAELSTTVYTYSDRDLLVHEDSPVSGETTHTYNGHGELVSTTDARPKTVTRTVDAADRVTFLDYADDTLDTDYDYGDENPGLVPFSNGRLTAITRDGHTVAYGYDRFGRTTRDGELTFDYDRNGNRTKMTYPGDVTATYTHDFADREEGLTVSVDGGPEQTVVADATYDASGPLTKLDFGTGVTETRVFDRRYFPLSIALDAARNRTWTYVTDGVGNVEQITSSLACAGDLLLSNKEVTESRVEDSCAAIEAGPDYTVANDANGTGDVTFRAATRIVLKNGFSVESGARFTALTDPSLSGDVTRTYGYQDFDYFLEEATGPWGTKTWEYDKIGNRTSETDFDGRDEYHYVQNADSGNTARLDFISLPTLGNRDYDYSPAGHQIEMDAGGNVVSFSYDDAGRLCEVTRTGGASTPFLYDGRSFLRRAGELTATTGTVEPLYDSAGLLHGLLRQPSTADPQTRYLIFHLAGRPVAQLALQTGQPERWWYFTTDHLGTPLVATDGLGEELWENRFEPFGRDMDQGLPWSALESEMFLRFPGQWEAQVWQEATMGAEVVYNVYRWHQPGIGRYTRADPVGIELDLNLYRYAASSPLRFTDPDGRLITPLPFVCAYFVGKDAQRQGQTFGWRWAHCWASCVITKDCGGAAVASRSGVVKELLDLLRCGGEVLRTGSRSGPYCESAFQPSDFDDNDTGIECPDEVPCEEHCRPFINKPVPPGPFFAPRQ